MSAANLKAANLEGRVAVSPSEFAGLFGRHKSWGYRQLYEGRVTAITSMGKTLIPLSEIQRILASAAPFDPKAKETQPSAEVPG